VAWCERWFGHDRVGVVSEPHVVRHKYARGSSPTIDSVTDSRGSVPMSADWDLSTFVDSASRAQCGAWRLIMAFISFSRVRPALGCLRDDDRLVTPL